MDVKNSCTAFLNYAAITNGQTSFCVLEHAERAISRAILNLESLCSYGIIMAFRIA